MEKTYYIHSSISGHEEAVAENNQHPTDQSGKRSALCSSHRNELLTTEGFRELARLDQISYPMGVHSNSEIFMAQTTFSMNALVGYRNYGDIFRKQYSCQNVQSRRNIPSSPIMISWDLNIFYDHVCRICMSGRILSPTAII